MAESKRNLRNRQAIIIVIVWVGGGWLGSAYVMEHWGWSFAVTPLVWLISLLLGFGCSWLITGQKHDPGHYDSGA